MVRSIVLVLVLIVFLCGAAHAQEGKFGLGVIIGEPTGLSLKAWLSDTGAVDAGVAWSFGDKDSLQLHVDYLVHNYDFFQVEKGRLPFYYGVGGRVRFRDDGDDELGVRIPVGLAYFIENTSLEVFAEVVPVVDLAPKTDADLNVGVGIRYYF